MVPQVQIPIEYFSQKLNKGQKNYSVKEKECLAAILGVKRFRPYVEMMPFTIITDPAADVIEGPGWAACSWSLQLQIYDFVIENSKDDRVN